MNQPDVIIIGAGPAGLSSAYELAKRGKRVMVFEKDRQVGGISKTIKYQDCYFDLGGHRFHTKLKDVQALWDEILGDEFLVRTRLSRIYYKNKFFNYPLKPLNAFFGLGILESVSIIFSYLKSKVFPYKEENNLEQWISNRFGKKLFRTFFKTYTEKVWGIPCHEIGSEWSAQRIKGLSLYEAIKNSLFPNGKNSAKTLIDSFRYPKYGPGMMYEKMAEKIVEMGGEVILNTNIKKIECVGGEVESIVLENEREEIRYRSSNFISTIPITNLVENIFPQAGSEVVVASKNLKFRSFIAINVILDKADLFPDNWIYIHSPEVKLGRVQNYGNWSPYMVDRGNRSTLGLEYFCNQNDELWNKPDQELIELGLAEMEKTNLLKKEFFVDGFVARVPKAYPVYDNAYRENVRVIREYLGQFSNLQTVGRGGMFRYNNMDHSVLAGLWAARNVLGEENDLWDIND